VVRAANLLVMKNPDLFAGCPERVRALVRSAKKAKREKARKDWWKRRANQSTEQGR